MAFKLIGRDSALVLKPLPLAVTCEMVNVPVPLFVSCTVCEPCEPTVTFPKLALDGVIVRAGWIPTPVTGITTEVPVDEDAVMLPLMFSAADGLKLTLITAF